MSSLILILLLVLCWSFNPFLKKKSASNLNSQEYLIYNQFLCSILVFLYFIYLWKNNKCSVNCLKKMSSNEIIYSLIAAFVTLLSSIILITLLKQKDASYLIPHIQPLVILLTITLGYFMFGENITKHHLLGGLLIISGVAVINFSK